MSIIKHKNQRVGIFIDTQNLYHSAKNLYKSKVSFGNVIKDALAGRNLIRAVAYVVTTESGEESGFFEALGKLGIEIKSKDLQIFFFGRSSSGKLRDIADDFIDMCENPRRYLMGYRGR